MSRALTISRRSTLAPEVLGARRGWALRWRRRELHVVRGSRGCRIAPAPPWPSPSHLKRCSSRPSRSAWNLTRRCGPEPGGGSDRVPGWVGAGRPGSNGRGGEDGAPRPPRIPPDRPCPAPAARALFLGQSQGVPRSGSGVSCGLRVPSLQAAQVAQFAVSAREVPTGDYNVDDNKWS